MKDTCVADYVRESWGRCEGISWSRDSLRMRDSATESESGSKMIYVV
jgi:hypothetical protein